MQEEFSPDAKIVSPREFHRSTRAQKNFWKMEFISRDDITGYEFSKQYCKNGYATWKFLAGHAVTKKEISQWVEELEVKLQARGLIAMANSNSDKAAQWLASRGWVPAEDKRTKDFKKKQAKAEEEIQEDFQRLGLRLVKKAE